MPLTVDLYLARHMSDEYPPEYVRGELVQRALPVLSHGRCQGEVAARLHSTGLLCAISLHMRLAEDLIRIADVAAYRETPKEEIPTTPPLITAEITAPGDLHETLLQKLGDYRNWGVPNIWVVEPGIQQLHIFEARGLIRVDEFVLPEFDFRLSAEELFAEPTAR